MTKDNQMIRVTVYPKRGGTKKITQIDSATITDIRQEDDGAHTGIVSNGLVGFPVRRECHATVWKGKI